jgi:hypothetical protein
VWSNLLSGTIGAVIGVAGAALVAVLTLTRTRRLEAEAARREHAIRVSGELAHRLVEFYDALRLVAPSEASDADVVQVRDLAEPGWALR